MRDCDNDTEYRNTVTVSCEEPVVCDDGLTPDGGWSHIDPAMNGDCDDEDANAYSGQAWYADCDGDGDPSALATTSCLEPTLTCADGLAPDGGFSNTAGTDCGALQACFPAGGE